MGRHKIPEIIELIENLKAKGESLGFVADDEYQVLDGLYYVDLIWSYREDHSLFITFEFENKGNDRMLKNLDKIFCLPSSEVEKSYHHFLIVFNEKLSVGMRKIVDGKIRLLNIHVFENLKNDQSEHQRLNKELEQLQIPLPDLIKRRGKANSANAIYDVLKGLDGVVPILVIQGNQHPIIQSTLTSSSKTIPQMPLSSSLKGMFDTARFNGVALIPIPRKRFTIIIPNTSIRLDVLQMKKEKDVRKTHLSFRACELPLKLDFDFMTKGGGGFHISINPSAADVVHVKKFEDILRAYSKHKALQIMDARGKVIAGCEGADLTKPLSSDEWYKSISDLASIQEAISHQIPCPKDLKISPKDLTVIARTKRILEAGEEIMPTETFTSTLSKESLEKLAEIQRNQKKISNLSVHVDRYSINLLGEKISLGPVAWKLPDMVFREPLEEVMKRISDIESKVLVKITMKPFLNTETRIIYRKWKK